MLVLGVAAATKLVLIVALIHAWQSVEALTQCVYFAAHASMLVFISVIILTTLIRFPPLRSAAGIEPFISALSGSFLLVTLNFLPVQLSVPVTLAGTLLVAAGGVASSYVLVHLGRSFSITAQARRLVTSGPYSHIRHPLYLAEELFSIGMILLVFSPLAVLIGLVHWGFQLRRMRLEERVLADLYPEYEQYCQSTPRLIPILFRPRRRSQPA